MLRLLKSMRLYTIALILLLTNTFKSNALSKTDVKNICENDIIENIDYTGLTKTIIPELNGKTKGDAGKVLVVGGSSKYTGAPYFAAISALKVGADLVHVITTEEAAPIIKSYSPDLIVVPHKLIDLNSIIKTVHIVVLGPGLGRERENLQLAYDTIDICKSLGKPMVIDADGLYAVYKNVSVLNGYPKPGAVLTPNHMEANRLSEAISSANTSSSWYSYWGDNISVLLKGEKDQFYSHGKLHWTIEEGGSGRRAGGQGDILAGALGTFFNWALQAKLCNDDSFEVFTRSIASYAAAKLTRSANSEAFKKHGRSMIASDMINDIHTAFDKISL